MKIMRVFSIFLIVVLLSLSYRWIVHQPSMEIKKIISKVENVLTDGWEIKGYTEKIAPDQLSCDRCLFVYLINYEKPKEYFGYGNKPMDSRSNSAIPMIYLYFTPRDWKGIEQLNEVHPRGQGHRWTPNMTEEYAIFTEVNYIPYNYSDIIYRIPDEFNK